MIADTGKRFSQTTAVFQALFVTFLWSTSWVLIKFGLNEIPALTFAGLRYTLAFLLLLPLFLQRGGLGQLRALSRRSWGQLLVLGLLFYTLTQGAQFLALAYLPAVTVNLSLSLTSVVVALLGLVLLQEYLTKRQWVGIVLSVAGAVVYFYPVQLAAGPALGYGVLVVGVLANGGAAVLGRAVNRRSDLSPLLVTIASMGSGATLLLATGVLVQGMPVLGWQSWAIIGWLALVNTAFAFTLWNLTLRTLSAAQSSVINNTMMIQIPILAVVFLGETITRRELIGLGVAALGILLVQLRRHRVTKREMAPEGAEDGP